MSRIRSDNKLMRLMPSLFGGGAAQNRDKNAEQNSTMGAAVFRILLTMCAGLIVCLGWYFDDRLQSYRVGQPSPRTYLAQSSTRFVDAESTEEVRGRVGNRIVAVRVRDEVSSQTVASRIDGLVRSSDMSFASPELVNVLLSLQEDTRSDVIDAALAVSEKCIDKATSRPELASILWEAIGEIDMPQAEKNIVFQLADSLMMPTVQEDADMTEHLRRDIVAQIPSVVRQIHLGSVIVSKGQMVTSEIADILRGQGYPDASIPWRSFCFTFVMTSIWSVWVTKFHEEAQIPAKHWWFAALMLIMQWMIQRATARLGIEFRGVDVMPMIAVTGWLFLTLPHSFAFQISVGGSIIGYFLAYPSMSSQVAVGCVISGVAACAGAILMSDNYSRLQIWRDLYKLGMLTALSSMFVRWGIGLETSWMMFAIYIAICAFWSSITVSCLSIWEKMFDLMSPLRLLELSHPSQSLMKRLQDEAPGTYHHTITVATLAAGVAEKIGMNALLVRTGAYYHDIGKLMHPNYFTENQTYGANIHDRLHPTRSGEYIVRHVKDGVKLAREAGLPEVIERFIKQHHGTLTLDYFYNKAVERDKEEGGDGSAVDRAVFTYDGPKPQMRETALLMLADSVEAGLKGAEKDMKEKMVNKTEAEKREVFKEFVSGVVDKKLSAGQLSDVNFTLREITAIKNAFADVLIGMYHGRDTVMPKDEEREAPRLVPADELAADVAKE